MLCYPVNMYLLSTYYASQALLGSVGIPKNRCHALLCRGFHFSEETKQRKKSSAQVKMGNAKKGEGADVQGRAAAAHRGVRCAALKITAPEERRWGRRQE